MKRLTYLVLSICISYFSVAQNSSYYKASIALSYGFYDSVLYYVPSANILQEYELIARASALQGKLNTAMWHYTQANTPSAWYELAVIYAKQQNIDSCLFYLAKHLSSENKKMYHEISIQTEFEFLYKTQAWREFWKYNWYSEYERSRERIHFLIGQGEYQNALLEIQELQKIEPCISNMEAYCYAKLSHSQKALKCINTKPVNHCFSEKYNDYEIFKILNMSSEAYERCRKYSHSQVGDISNLFKSACYAFEAQKYTEAYTQIREYCSYDYANDYAMYIAAQICEAQKLSIEALQYINKALELKQSAEYYFFRANIFLTLHQYAFAEKDFSMSLDYDPKLEVYFNRGQARRFQGNMHGACLDYTRAYKLGNFDARYYSNKYCQ